MSPQPPDRPRSAARAVALLPLALLTTVWPVTPTGAVPSASADRGGTLPDGTAIPTQAVQAPAAPATVPGMLAPASGAGAVVTNASANGIPAAALAAYQRAETVINAADRTCRLPWQLLAAIGRVESDHGRYAGNTLGDDGVARPGIYGLALDGTHHTQRILDTDAGQYDQDARFDRAVGPMQFIPTTWSVVAVDADGDGNRDPQDIDDAALATAVYLCSGQDDLATTSGQRAAVYRYNHSTRYVDLVLSLTNAYGNGDYTAVPNGATSGSYFVPTGTTQGPVPSHHQSGPHHHHAQPDSAQPGPIEPTQATEPTQQPTQEPAQPTQPMPTEPSGTPSDPVTGPVTGAVADALTWAEAEAQCLATGISALDAVRLDTCVTDLMAGVAASRSSEQ